MRCTIALQLGHFFHFLRLAVLTKSASNVSPFLILSHLSCGSLKPHGTCTDYMRISSGVPLGYSDMIIKYHSPWGFGLGPQQVNRGLLVDADIVSCASPL